jgi:hypothetical protein
MRVFGDLNETDSAPAQPVLDPGKASVGGIPPTGPSARPNSGGPSGQHVSDRIGDQVLEPEGYIYNHAETSSPPSNVALWFVLMVVLLGLIGASGYLYRGLRKNNVRLSQVPEILQSVTTLGGRLDATEAKLHDLTADWDGLTNRVAELGGKIDSGLKATRNQTRELVGQAERRLNATMDQRGKAVDARLNDVESIQRQERAQLAQLNDQLRGQVSSLREQLNADHENTGRDLAGLQGQVTNNEGNLQTLVQQLHRGKVTFEIVKNNPTELAPGVTLTVLKTDVSYQRFRGYVSLTNEGKTLWLNNLSAKESVDLFSQHSNHPYSLVVTAVNDDGVAGYLLLPAGA